MKRIAATVLVLAAASLARAATPAQKCESAAVSALAACFAKVGEQVRLCYLKDGAACAGTDATIAGALAKLETNVERKCASPAVVQAAGFGDVATPADLVGRLQESCRGEPASLAARTFGGPQAALLASTDAATTPGSTCSLVLATGKCARSGTAPCGISPIPCAAGCTHPTSDCAIRVRAATISSRVSQRSIPAG